MDASGARTRSRFTYANVISTLALLIAIGGGTAYAASISGSSLVNRSVSRYKVKLNALTGAEIRESALATVPKATTTTTATNATKLGGINAASFLNIELGYTALEYSAADATYTLPGAVTDFRDQEWGYTAITNNSGGQVDMDLVIPLDGFPTMVQGRVVRIERVDYCLDQNLPTAEVSMVLKRMRGNSLAQVAADPSYHTTAQCHTYTVPTVALELNDHMSVVLKARLDDGESGVYGPISVSYSLA